MANGHLGKREPRMAASRIINEIIERYEGVERVDLCALLGITPSYLSLLIDGEREPSATVRERMTRLLNDPKGLLKDWNRDMERKLQVPAHA